MYIFIFFWLVVWNHFLVFHSVGNVIIPTEELTHIVQDGMVETHQPDCFCADIYKVGPPR